tara:strand:+ start:17882 stop:18292 length:411 start_codon:yes stop_codon:yes gene_type:complete
MGVKSQETKTMPRMQTTRLEQEAQDESMKEPKPTTAPDELDPFNYTNFIIYRIYLHGSFAAKLGEAKTRLFIALVLGNIHESQEQIVGILKANNLIAKTTHFQDVKSIGKIKKRQALMVSLRAGTHKTQKWNEPRK